MKKKLLIAYLRIVNNDMIKLKIGIMEQLPCQWRDEDTDMINAFDEVHEKIKTMIVSMTEKD